MKKLLFTICALLAVGSTFAENTFSINTVYASTSGISTIEVNYSLDAEFACGGFSFDIQLPDKFEFVGKNAYTPGDCYASTPTFTTNLTADGVLKVAYATSDPLTKQSGTLASFQIRAKSTAVAGTTYYGLLTAAKFVDNSTSASENAADVPFNIVATDRVILDENSTSAPVAADGVDVTVMRSLKKDVWNTVCLPFGMEVDAIKDVFGDGVQIAVLSDWAKDTDGNFTIVFSTYDWAAAEWFAANWPYLVKPTKDVTSFDVDNVDIDGDMTEITQKAATSIKGKKASFTGVLTKTAIAANDLFISGNKFYYSTGSTTMKAFRGYFKVPGFTSSSPAPTFVVDGETTSIDEINIVDGDGRIYNLNGQHVENPTSKGVYIQNGKKVVIKK